MNFLNYKVINFSGKLSSQDFIMIGKLKLHKLVVLNDKNIGKIVLTFQINAQYKFSKSLCGNI